jgi:cytochrome c biogenesis protein CcdA
MVKPKMDIEVGANPKREMTKRYGFGLGVFRGATPCLKVLILAPLLIISPLELAIMMVLVFTIATTTYPVIGFLSANIFKNFRKYDTFVQTAGAIMLIGIGIFMMLNELANNYAIIGV